jgi:hypothetical protein
MRPSLTGRHNTALIARLHAEDQAHEAQLRTLETLKRLCEEDRKLRERNEEIYLRYIRGWFGIKEQG